MDYKYNHLKRAIFFSILYPQNIIFVEYFTNLKMEKNYNKSTSPKNTSPNDFFGMNHEKILFSQDKRQDLRQL